MAGSVIAGFDSTGSNGRKPNMDEHAILQMLVMDRNASPAAEDFARGMHKRQRQQAESRHGKAEHDESIDDLLTSTDKKRRLTVEQLTFLEMSFKNDLRLEPERKVLIAKQLGLRPRQVAIWFQNKRARCRNKQVEQDYVALKAKYDESVEEKMAIIKQNEAVLEDNKRLQAEVYFDSSPGDCFDVALMSHVVSQVDRLMSLLQAQKKHGVVAEADVAGAIMGTPILPFNTGSGFKEEQQASPKSEMTSLTKSSEDHSEPRGSELGYAMSSAAIPYCAPSLTSLMERRSSVFECSGALPWLPAVKPEYELPGTAAAIPGEAFGSVCSAVQFQQLAAVNPVFFEDYTFNNNLNVLNWEDQFHGQRAWSW